MKKIILSLVLIAIYAQSALAQFAVVRDSVGHNNVYYQIGDFENTIAKAVDNDIVYLYPYDEDIVPWQYIDYYTAPMKFEPGYMLRVQLRLVEEYDIIEVTRLSSTGSISFGNDTVRVMITTSNVPKNSRLIRKESNGYYSVNGKRAKGIEKDYPQKQYQSITVSIKKKSIVIPRSQFDNLFEPSLEDTSVFYDNVNQTVFILANNGKAEDYSVLWVIDRNGKSKVYVRDSEY